MAYRCKKCGYRFKASDSDLCPECFTAREDISCVNYSDSSSGKAHSHIKDSADGDDFIARQLREENRLTGDELSEEISNIAGGIKNNVSEGLGGLADEIKRSLGGGTVPPNTYHRSISQPQYGQTVYRQTTYGQAANRQAAYNQAAYRQTAYQPQRSFTAYRGSYAQQEFEIDHPEKPAHTVRNIILGAIFLNIIVMFLTMTIFSTVDDSKSGSRKSGKSSALDGKIDCFYLGGRSDMCIRNGCYGIDDGTPGMLEISFDKYIDTKWYRFGCDLTVKDSWTPEELILECIDDSNIVISTWTTPLEQYRTESGAQGVPLCFTPTSRYKLILKCKDKKGNDGKLVFEPDMTKLRDDIIPKPEDFPSYEPNTFAYDYDTSADVTSLADLGGSGYKLKLTGAPVELTYEPEGKLSFEDDSLADDDIRLCRVSLVNADGRAAEASREQATLAGFDANDSPAYYYSVKRCNELPISSRVRNYEVYLTVEDKEGFDSQLHFVFTSSDLYDSIKA